MNNHLGDRVTALVDGEVDHATRDRLLAHVASCPGCYAELDEQRRLKATLTALSAPHLSEDLSIRLRRLAEPGEPVRPRRDSHDRSRVAYAGMSRDSGRLDRLPAVQQRRMFFGSVALGAVAATVGTAFVLGAPAAAPAVPAVTPSVDQFSREHALTAADVGLPDPANVPVTTSSATTTTRTVIGPTATPSVTPASVIGGVSR
jgi:anti-sigma factor RsiW